MAAYITTYHARFTAALKNLVGKTPPPSMVTAWLEDDNDAEHFRLQDWVNTNTKGMMNHIQGIAILDAARIVADNPDEGANHEPAPDDRLDPFPKHQEAILGAVFQAWMTTSTGKLVVVVPTVEERIAFIETLQSGWDAVPFFYYAKRLDVKVYYREIWDTLKEYPYIINLTCSDDSDD